MGRKHLSIAWGSDLTTTRWRRRGKRRTACPSRARLGVEVLEGRIVLTTLPPNFIETPVVSGLNAPTAMEFAPDGRLFVLEQGGNVKLVHSDGTTWTALHLNVDSNGERGLLGIAFDPNYSSNHFVYLYYTNPNPGAAPWATGEHNQLSRFTVNDSNPQQPVFTNEAPILDWNNLSAATNHNGGAIHFGARRHALCRRRATTRRPSPRGATPTGSPRPSPTSWASSSASTSANSTAASRTRDDTTVGHLIPADNPFVGTAAGINQLIYVLGLRNPYTFAVQPGTGTIFINDVGEITWEEIDQSVAGANFGWSGGNTDGFGQSPPGPGTYHDPLLAYNHSGGPAGGGIAIVGGTFYNPATPQFPSSYVGKYFYDDLASGWIRVFDPANPGNASNPDTSTAFASGTPGRPARPQGRLGRQPLLPLRKRRSDQQDLLRSPGHGHVPEAGHDDAGDLDGDLRRPGLRRHRRPLQPAELRHGHPARANDYVWAASTTDPRALQTSGGSSRIAATWWTTTSFTVDVNLTDGQAHDLELYFLDWDQQGRTEQVQISDASTGAVLSTQTISSFQSGVYLDYAVSGNIVITITRRAGTSNVLSGLFLDPASTSTLDLTANQSIYSPNGQYQLIMQGDGNLVEYGPGGQVIWDAGTNGNPGAYAIMQGDGNLVVYSPAGKALWRLRHEW